MAKGFTGNWSDITVSGPFSAPKTPNMKSGGRIPKSKGNIIMEVAEILLPWLTKMLDGVRDNKGMLVQPSTIRGLALNVAQDVFNKYNSSTENA